MSSSEFYQHTGMLHDSLRALLEQSAVECAPARYLGTGLLGPRTNGNSEQFRPKLIVVSGIASLAGQLLGEVYLDNVLAVAETREDIAIPLGRICMVCPGTAKDALERVDLDDGQIVKLSHSATRAEPQRPTLADAKLYYQQIFDKMVE